MTMSPDPWASLTPEQLAHLTPEQRQQWGHLWHRFTPEQRWQWESLQMQREMFAAHQAENERRRQEMVQNEMSRRAYNRTARGVVLGCLGLPVLLLLLLILVL